MAITSKNVEDLTTLAQTELFTVMMLAARDFCMRSANNKIIMMDAFGGKNTFQRLIEGSWSKGDGQQLMNEVYRAGRRHLRGPSFLKNLWNGRRNGKAELPDAGRQRKKKVTENLAYAITMGAVLAGYRVRRLKVKGSDAEYLLARPQKHLAL